MVHLIYSLKKIMDTILLFVIIHYNLFGALNKAKLFVYLTIQVLLELSLIRDCDEVEQLVFSGWEKYYPKILNMSKAPQTDSEYNLFGALNKAKLFVYLTIQVLLELSLIRDCDEVEQLVFSGWEKYYPKILNMSKAPQTDSEYHALIIIDKKLRPNGSRNSAPAAFSFHKVRSLSNMIEQHLVNFNTKDNVLSFIPGRYST